MNCLQRVHECEHSECECEHGAPGNVGGPGGLVWSVWTQLQDLHRATRLCIPEKERKTIQRMHVFACACGLVLLYSKGSESLEPTRCMWRSTALCGSTRWRPQDEMAGWGEAEVLGNTWCQWLLRSLQSMSAAFVQRLRVTKLHGCKCFFNSNKACRLILSVGDYVSSFFFLDPIISFKHSFTVTTVIKTWYFWPRTSGVCIKKLRENKQQWVRSSLQTTQLREASQSVELLQQTSNHSSWWE